MEVNAEYNMEKQERTTLIREQARVEDIVMTIKNEIWICSGHIMRRTDHSICRSRMEYAEREGER